MLFSGRTSPAKLLTPRRRRFSWSDWNSESSGALEARQLLSGSSVSVPAAEVHTAARSKSNAGRTLNLADAFVYTPAGLLPGRTYPMVVAFTPDGKVRAPWVTGKRSRIGSTGSSMRPSNTATGRPTLRRL